MIIKYSDLSPAWCLHTIAQLTTKRHFVLAYSGGVDSQVLLHLLAKAQQLDSTIKLRAIHINHQLSGYSSSWQKHCQTVCEQLAVPLDIIQLNIPNNSGDSLEALARELRYLALTDNVDRDECLLCAHHQDDQSETILLQLMRGAGVKGLAAMPKIKSCQNKSILRPFLDVRKKQLVAYAQHHQLSWIEDDSNSDDRFDRNYIRQHVMPLLADRWPSMQESCARSAQHCATSSELLDDLAEIDLSITSVPEHHGILKLAPLRALSASRIANAMRFWLAQNNCLLPQTKQMNEIIKQLFSSKPDALPMIEIDNYQLRRYQDSLYLMGKSPQHDSGWSASWNLQQPLQLPTGLGKLAICEHQSYGMRTNLDCNQIKVRFRQGGERIQLGCNNSCLKKLFQQWAVPPWLRNRVPLLFYQEQLIAVVGYAIAKPYQVEQAGSVVCQLEN